ncbi:hypothetical protein [Frankia sp. R43]|uniref:hypothetical protein n=1 Tax=Frankia sp. R43 TaxID=269536 RepID=UPI0006CA28DB|nr:hypothetical protein [Frankia sp. R43]
MRTTVLNERGVRHKANPALNLSKDGVFAYRYLRSVDLAFFTVPGAVEYLGMLENACFAKILEWWERS